VSRKLKNSLWACVFVFSGFGAVPRAAEAHHGWAEFDSNSGVTLQGTVTDFHFTNPHCVVDFDVKDEKGQVRKWQGEFASPPELTRKGWTAATLQPGDKLTITGHPAKNGALSIHVTSIQSDGKEPKHYNGN
jgi:hypothetical protein